ncbi:MAG: hypothetical protein IKW83_11715 [Muribaculaceae bacterium]|nr:hypothetical protein [Muribaculaceae bacterium]
METTTKFTKTLAALIFAAVPFAFIIGLVNMVSCNDSGATGEVEIASMAPKNAGIANNDYSSGSTGSAQVPSIHAIPKVTSPEINIGQSQEFLKEQEEMIKRHNEMMKIIEDSHILFQDLNSPTLIPYTVGPVVPENSDPTLDATTTDDNTTPNATQTIATCDSI